jgi:predicted acyltransferase
VFAGACVGVLIDASNSPHRETVTYRRLAIAGAAVSVIGLAGSFLPSPFVASDFWTTSPAYVFVRGGLTIMAVAGCHAWVRARGDGARWSALTQLGRTSLFIYWIHVELVYGLISRPWHRALTLFEASLAYVIFCLLMLACSLAKERIARRFRHPAGPGGREVAAFSRASVPTRSQPSGE